MRPRPLPRGGGTHPAHNSITAEGGFMSGQWIEDPTSPSGWRYDDTPSDPTVTSMLPVYAGPVDLIDNLCEDRHPSELSDEDGVD